MSTRKPLPNERYRKAEIWFDQTKQGDLENLQIYHFTEVNRIASLGVRGSTARPVETKERECIAFVQNPSDKLLELTTTKNNIPFFTLKNIEAVENGTVPPGAILPGIEAIIEYIQQNTNQIKIYFKMV